MKRSEMIERLIEQIDTMRGVARDSDGVPFYVYPEDEQIADRLLTIIERAGMLPPFVSEIYYRSAQTSHPENPQQWEPEDEK